MAAMPTRSECASVAPSLDELKLRRFSGSLMAGSAGRRLIFLLQQQLSGDDNRSPSHLLNLCHHSSGVDDARSPSETSGSPRVVDRRPDARNHSCRFNASTSGRPIGPNIDDLRSSGSSSVNADQGRIDKSGIPSFVRSQSDQRPDGPAGTGRVDSPFDGIE